MMEVTLVKDSEKKKYAFTKIDFLFMLGVTILVYLGIKMLVNVALGGFITLQVFVFCSMVYVYIKSKRITISKGHMGYLLYTLLLGISFSIYENQVLAGVSEVMLVLSIDYWILNILRIQREGLLQENIVMDILESLIITPLSHVKDIVMSMKINNVKSNENRKYVYIGILISIPGVMVIVPLLASADYMFNKMLLYIEKYIIVQWVRDIPMVLLAIPLGIVLFTYVYKNIYYGNKKRYQNVTIRNIPNLISVTVLSIFSSIYAIFILLSVYGYMHMSMHAGYAMAGTISEYAREGFFQLVVVAGINIILFFVIMFVTEKTRLVKGLLTIVGVETLGIIILGVVKMILYIQKYHFTVLRFQTLFFMIILFISVIFFIIGIWKPWQYIKYTIWVVGISFLCMSYINIGKMMVTYNVSQYVENTEQQLDVSVFYEVGIDALPVAIDSYTKIEDETLKREISSYIRIQKQRINRENTITWSRMKSIALLAE